MYIRYFISFQNEKKKMLKVKIQQPASTSSLAILRGKKSNITLPPPLGKASPPSLPPLGCCIHWTLATAFISPHQDRSKP